MTSRFSRPTGYEEGHFSGSSRSYRAVATMAQDSMLDPWIKDIQNSNAGVDRRSGYYHKTLSSLPFELYTHIMGADASDATQDCRELHLPGYGTIRHFEGVAVLEKRCYMLLCITDSELLLFSMGSDAEGV